LPNRFSRIFKNNKGFSWIFKRGLGFLDLGKIRLSISLIKKWRGKIFLGFKKENDFYLEF
jgi:hypothetical protein